MICTLFADDTTVYLSERDNFGDLTKVLNKWCSASGAKFNIENTEVTPLGVPEYRKEVLGNRKLHSGDVVIPMEIHISPDGAPTHVLGSWVGNGVNQMNVCFPTVEKIEYNLMCWCRSNPSMEGKSLILQMEVAGRTKYLTRVQGMPQSIEQQIRHVIPNFICNGKLVSPVDAGTLASDLTEGGQNVLDLEARNEAINIMWVQRYLAALADRPHWALIADELIWSSARHGIKKDEPGVTINVFLQTWLPKLREG